MASKSIISSSNLLPNSNNTFSVNGTSGESAIIVDENGNTIIKKLILVDDKTGNKWQVKISDGELIAEPLELEDKREHKLKRILNGSI